MAMNEQDYNRYRQRVEQLATKQSDDPYRQRFEQLTANTPASQNITPAYRGNERPHPTVGQNPPVSGGGASIDDDAWKYGRVDTRPQSISPEEQAWTNQMRQYRQTQAERAAYDRQYEQAFGGRPTARQMQTQAYPGRPYQRTPYQQALDDYDINSWPPMQSAPRQSYAPPQQSRFGGAPMPNRSPGQAQYTPLPDRNPGQAQYTTLPDRSPGQAQYTPYANNMSGQAGEYNPLNVYNSTRRPGSNPGQAQVTRLPTNSWRR